MMTQPPHSAQRTAGALLCVLALSLAGCQGEDAGAAGLWLDFEGPDGTRIALDGPPKRIVAATVGVTEMLLELVDRERVAGVPDQVFQGFATACGNREEWSGRILREFRGEALLALRPDLVIAESYQDADACREVRAIGVPVLVLPEVTSFDDLVGNLDMIARCCGARDRAADLASRLDARHQRLLADTSRRDIQILSYSNYDTGGWTAGSGCAADLMIRLAGMQNAGARDGRARHWQIDFERFADLDPEFVLVGKDARGQAPAEKLLRTHTTLRGLRAVQDGKIVTLPTALWNTTSHRLLDAAEQLAAAVDAKR